MSETHFAIHTALKKFSVRLDEKRVLEIHLCVADPIKVLQETT